MQPRRLPDRVPLFRPATGRPGVPGERGPRQGVGRAAQEAGRPVHHRRRHAEDLPAAAIRRAAPSQGAHDCFWRAAEPVPLNRRAAAREIKAPGAPRPTVRNMRKNNTHRAGTPRALIGFTPALCRAPSPLRPPRAGWWGLARHFHYLPELAARSSGACRRAAGARFLSFTSSPS